MRLGRGISQQGAYLSGPTGFREVEPPTVILPLPTQQMTTVTVTLANRVNKPAVRLRVAPHPRLFPPAVVEPYLRPPDRRLEIQAALAVIARRIQSLQRQPHWKIWPPAVLSLPPPIIAAYTAAIRTRYDLARRAPHYNLARPATLEPASIAQRERSITVQLAGRTRAEVGRRAPHPFWVRPATLEPEAVELREQTITVTLAGATRLGLPRRAPHYKLSPSSTLEPESVEQAERTIKTLLVRIRPPAIRSFVRPPTRLRDLPGIVLLTNSSASLVRLTDEL